MTNSVSSLLSETIAAHGGGERWRASPELDVEVSAGGLAVAAKFQRRALLDLEARVSTEQQRIVFTPYPRRGYRGIFDRGAVRIESADGTTVQSRSDARAALSRPRRLLWWDDLDVFYFGASALWTYLAIPFIFTDPGFHVREGDPWEERGERWRRLAVTFPAEIHTHSREQVFYVGEDGLIRRHDYTAEEFGQWAKSAHYWFDHHDFDGLAIARKRRVVPRRANNHSRSHPVLVWVDVNEVTRFTAASPR
jgi:hypothetical protein